VGFNVANGVLPPIKHLAVSGADYTKHDISHIFNFSKLESLHIRHSCGRNYLKTVPPQAIAGIRVLNLENPVGPAPGRDPQNCIPLDIVAEFLGGIKSLLEISLTCHSPTNVITLLSQHCKALEVLRLGDTSLDNPTTTVHDIMLMEASFPHLSELQVDLDFPLFEPNQNLDVLDDDEKGPVIQVF